MKEWNGFIDGNWTKDIDVSDFILKNYTYYSGNSSFLKGTTNKTKGETPCPS